MWQFHWNAGRKPVDPVYKEWIKNLPSQLDDETLIDKSFGYFTDSVGNWLMNLPSKPVEDLNQYFRDNFDVRSCDE
jgi:hypothetical protein